MMIALNTVMPFIGIGAVLWAVFALISAIFPGNRKRRLISSGISLSVFLVAIGASDTVERMAKQEELDVAGVENEEQLTALRENEARAAALKVGASYMERLAELRDIADATTGFEVSSEMNDIWLAAEIFERGGQLIQEGAGLDLASEQEAARQDFRVHLSQQQAELFPKIRDAYGPALRRELWEADGWARSHAAGFRRLEVVNPLFAANRNIADFHKKSRETFLQLRFTRIDYKWFRQASEYSYMSLEPPADHQVGFWKGAKFIPVD
ncbi:hypothetical protein [Pontibaca salina]|uniref:Uncharacterized protein n=1 Tax=Pontibaca salina TaxID=2795731 RepID=A0A934M3D8_9RHOB|nr:hypothetical protein [Pontibaca salina]MBI6629744.1 hypothetical protein [Pontibaca salina]